VVVSLFVNPMQFGAGEDFQAYPRDMERDALLAAKEGADILFAPKASQVYPPAFTTFVEVAGLTEGLCGASRPGHFRGVTTVVAKLFNMVQPDLAYFGQKDAQQALVIRRMARDLDFPVKVVILPTVREADGLAMSSRNTYLTPGERKVAPLLYQSLKRAEERIKGGERQRRPVIDAMQGLLETESQIKIDYVDIVSHRGFTAPGKPDGGNPHRPGSETGQDPADRQHHIEVISKIIKGTPYLIIVNGSLN
jgi:pantoate--beta-alanine ligase